MGEELDKMFEKFQTPVKTIYINDSKLMEDFNERTPKERDAVIEQFFDEMTRMFLELKMSFTEKTNFELASSRLNYFFLRTLKILYRLDFNTAMEKYKELTRR